MRARGRSLISSATSELMIAAEMAGVVRQPTIGCTSNRSRRQGSESDFCSASLRCQLFKSLFRHTRFLQSRTRDRVANGSRSARGSPGTTPLTFIPLPRLSLPIGGLFFYLCERRRRLHSEHRQHRPGSVSVSLYGVHSANDLCRREGIKPHSLFQV